MKTFIPEKIKNHRKIRRNIGVSLLSFILALSFVFAPMSEASVTEKKQASVAETKQAGTAEWRLHYQNLTDDEKTVYDTIDTLMDRFSPIDLTWDEIMEKVSENKEGAEGVFREYVGSGQAIKLELSRDYSDEDGENAINTGVRYAYVADHPLDMRAQLCGILSHICGSTVYVCLYYNAGYRDFDAYQKEADAAYEKDLAAICADKRFEEGNKSVIELVISDYVCSKIKYYDSGDWNQSNTTYGPLISRNGVCEAITLYTCLLNNSFGIDTYCLSSGEHAWNLVKLDDDYYELDNTWDLVNDYGINYHKYFNLTTKQITGGSGKNEDESHDRDPIGNRLPEATGTKYTYRYLWEITGKVSEKPLPESGVFPAKNKFKSKGLVFRLEKDGTAVLISADYKKGKLTIPHHVKYKGWLYEVYMIDSGVFYNYAELKTVILPKSVVVIGDSTFYGCKKLKNITLGNVEIGAAAFKGIRKKAHFYVQCEESEFDEVKAQIKGSGAKKPQIEHVSM